MLRQMLADRRATSRPGLLLAAGQPIGHSDAGNANPIPPHERRAPAGGDS